MASISISASFISRCEAQAVNLRSIQNSKTLPNPKFKPQKVNKFMSLSDSDIAKLTFNNSSSEIGAEMLDTDDEVDESLSFEVDESLDGRIVDFCNDDESLDFEDEEEEEVYYYDSDGKLINLSENQVDDSKLELKAKGLPAFMRSDGVVAETELWSFVAKSPCLWGSFRRQRKERRNVYLEVDGAMNSILPSRNCVHYRTGGGAHGQGRMKRRRKQRMWW